MLGEEGGRRAEKHVDILDTYLGGLGQIRGSIGIERKARDAKLRPRGKGEGNGYDSARLLGQGGYKRRQGWHSASKQCWQ